MKRSLWWFIQKSHHFSITFLVFAMIAYITYLLLWPGYPSACNLIINLKYISCGRGWRLRKREYDAGMIVYFSRMIEDQRWVLPNLYSLLQKFKSIYPGWIFTILLTLVSVNTILCAWRKRSYYPQPTQTVEKFKELSHQIPLSSSLWLFFLFLFFLLSVSVSLFFLFHSINCSWRKL